MKRLRADTILLMVGLAAMTTAACAAVLDWDPEGLRCSGGECAEGFSCLVNRCVGDNTLVKGQTCNNDQQCAADPVQLICAPNLFTCRGSCADSAFFKPTGDCTTGEYCKPFRDANDNWVGVCVPSDDCRTDADCGPGNACVKINTTAFACLTRCQLDWNMGYSDNCGASAISPKYCQPLGAREQERLICLDTELGAAGVMQPCRPVDAPCQQELACIEGVCKRHCDPLGGGMECNMAMSERCCVRMADDVTYGICDVTCS